MYRFTDQEVFRHRIEPQNKEEARPEPDKWTDIKDSFFPYDMKLLNCANATERSLLTYIFSAAATPQFEYGLSLCVFGKRQLHHVQLRKQEIHTEDVNYTEKKQQTQKQEAKTITAIKIGITAEPLASNKNR